MSEILDNEVFNLKTIEEFKELERTRFSNKFSKSTLNFMYGNFKEDTYFYLYKPGTYYIISGDKADKHGFEKKTFEDFKNKYL